MDIIDIYRLFHPNTKEYTFFSVPNGTIFTIDHTLSHKTNLNRDKKIEINPFILSDHHGLKLDFNNSRKNRKLTNI
jgi:exonuclease III